MPKIILIIDDDIYSLLPYTTALENAGYKVETASRPKEGYEKAKELILESKLDLIILDLMMPTGTGKLIDIQESKGGRDSGLILLRKLREANIDVPVVVFTVRTDRDVEEELINLGTERFIRKMESPPSEVIKIIDSVLNKQS